MIYNELSKIADRLIGRYGAPVLYIERDYPSGEDDAPSQPLCKKICQKHWPHDKRGCRCSDTTGVIRRRSGTETEEQIENREAKIIIAGNNDFVPDAGGFVYAGEELYEISAVEKVAPGGTPLIYVLTCNI
ncbi:MAG: hypothetical protein JAY72_07945 [Candidatus Thiodiazotropha endolucinida]|nr:hypothetical protein [Candidatus Thiodiazotropha taylori]MCW4321598.1 hypothetical protein [Candidatus Thiodiazotropha taylori]